ncbi:response regulator [hydrocarbon metagenome]|uniref:Response regulator n=1 Tax=hydrocarbon metagenome TaxID=938273 RepID=A0A0W8E6B5_9ZZZZ
MGGKILVASSAAAERKLISEILRRAGHTVSAETADIAHTLRRTRSLFPDLVIIDNGLDGTRGLKAAEIIAGDQLAAVLLLVDSDIFPQARNYHYLIRPANHNSLVPAVEAALYYWRRESGLREQIRKLEDTLETRKLTDKAKGLLIDKMNMSEHESHRFIQKEAMKRSITLRQVAVEIIEKLGPSKNN